MEICLERFTVSLISLRSGINAFMDIVVNRKDIQFISSLAFNMSWTTLDLNLLVQCELEVREEIENIMHHEKMLWRQK